MTVKAYEYMTSGRSHGLSGPPREGWRLHSTWPELSLLVWEREKTSKASTDGSMATSGPSQTEGDCVAVLAYLLARLENMAMVEDPAFERAQDVARGLNLGGLSLARSQQALRQRLGDRSELANDIERLLTGLPWGNEEATTVNSGP